MAHQIQLRRDTSANWELRNIILAEGEMGVELPSRKVKIGDGVTPWNSLGYFFIPDTVYNFVWAVNGDASVGYIGYYEVLEPGTIQNVRVSVETLPVGSSLLIDIRKNGVNSTSSIFPSDVPIEITPSTPGTNGVYSVNTTTFDIGDVTLVNGDVLRVYVTQVGSTTPGSSLMIKVTVG